MYNPPALHAVPAAVLADAKLASLPFDALVVVAPSPLAGKTAALGVIADNVEAAIAADASLGSSARSAVVLPAPVAPGGRLVLATTGPLTDDTEDVRLVAEAIAAAVARAVEAGASRPLVTLASVPASPRFAHALDVAALAALASQWSPLEARESDKPPKAAEALGVLGLSDHRVRYLQAIELGRSVCRDITGTDPERMTAARTAELCESAFAGTGVELRVETDVSKYPLLAAVARASNVVERHRPRVIRLEYRPEGTVTRTLLLAGKGVTYDTGGADVKTEGAMAGMSRDKGGAGAVAGLIRAAAALALPGVRIVGLLGMVRNSIGEESYVTDEILKARSGVRVRVGNTDAEGRLVLADLLAAAKEIASSAEDPLIMSIATLTGHVYRAHGPYTGALGNAAARDRGYMEALDRFGELWGEPVEPSRPRREDYAFVAARTSAEDVVSSNRLPSVSTPRGHQFPFAFLDIAAGLRGAALPFIHLDIGGTAVEGADWQFGKPTGTPIATLLALLAQR